MSYSVNLFKMRILAPHLNAQRGKLLAATARLGGVGVSKAEERHRRRHRAGRASDWTKSTPLAASDETRRRHRNKNGAQIWEARRSQFSARGRTAPP